MVTAGREINSLVHSLSNPGVTHNGSLSESLHLTAKTTHLILMPYKLQLTTHAIIVLFTSVLPSFPISKMFDIELSDDFPDF